MHPRLMRAQLLKHDQDTRYSSKAIRRATHGTRQVKAIAKVDCRPYTSFPPWQQCSWLQSEIWLGLGGMLPGSVSLFFLLLLLLFLGLDCDANLWGNMGVAFHRSRVNGLAGKDLTLESWSQGELFQPIKGYWSQSGTSPVCRR